MFSLFYLYFLVDYEFLLSNNEKIFGQEILFKDKENLIFKYFFDYILERNNKYYLKKYTVNEEIMDIIETVLEPYLGIDGVLDYVDYNMAKEIFKKNNINNFNYKKMAEIDLLVFINDCVEEKFGHLEYEIRTKIYRDFVDFVEKEKIFYLTNDELRHFDPLDLASCYKFWDFGDYRFSRLRDQDNQLKKRRFQDIKFSRLFLDFCEK